MAKYIFRELSAEEAEEADAFAQKEFEEEERARQADRLAHRLAGFLPHEGLKRLRSKHGLTQAAIAGAVGVTRRTYQFYESGQKSIPSDVVSRLAAIYNCDIHELFTGTAHSDNLQVKAETAQLAVAVICKIMKKFEKNRIPFEDMQRVAMEVARSHPLGTPIERVDLFEAIQIVTGEKYVKSEVAYRDVEQMDADYD